MRMIEKIKEFISGMSIIGFIIGALLIGGYIDTHYTREATVVDVVSDEVVLNAKKFTPSLRISDVYYSINLKCSLDFPT